MSKFKYRFLPAIDKKYYPAIGFTIVQWAFLETEIDSHIIGLMTQHAKIAPAKIPRPFNQRAALYRQLAKVHYSGEALSIVLAIIDKSVICRKERDWVAHGRWSVGQDESFVERWKDGFHHNVKPLTTEQIYNVAADISELNYRLFSFHRKFDLRVRPPAPDPKFFSQDQQGSPKRRFPNTHLPTRKKPRHPPRSSRV